MKKSILTKDGSQTLFSQHYNQNFHDEKTGALSESLEKHIIPAFDFHKEKEELNILDICFGLGYNTFASIHYVKKNNLKTKLNIYSPELDETLLNSLKTFEYPKEFESIKKIIKETIDHKKYEDDTIKIELKVIDAREYIKTLKNIDIVYQDAFSSDVNKELWSIEYFKDIFSLCSEDSILTTYSIATPVRLSMYEAGFEIYEKQGASKKLTLGFKKKQNIDAKYIDMELKKQRNKEASPIYDNS